MDYDELLTLREDFSGLTSAEAEKVGRDLYDSLYLNNGRPHPTLRTHDGQALVFQTKGQYTFDHIFFTSSNLAGYPFRKDVLDMGRLERMRWIAPIIGGRVEGVEYRKESFWRRGAPAFKRLYILPQEGYVIWVEPQIRDGWTLATAYTPAGAVLADYRRKTLLSRVFKKNTP